MKTKKMSFRIVTALLAVCMMLPLMPATGNVASAAGERETETISFKTAATSGSWVNYPEDTWERCGWRILECTGTGVNLGMTKIRIHNSYSVAALNMINKDEYGTFEFKSPTNGLEGYYEVKINGLTYGDGGFDGAVYIDDVYVGTYNCDDPDKEAKYAEGSFDIGTVKVSSADTHKLKIVRTTASTGNGGSAFDCFAFVSEIIFEPTSAPEYYLSMTANNDDNNIYNRTLNDGWMLNTDLTRGILNYKTDESGNPTNAGWTKFYGEYLRVHLDVGGVFAIDFNLADDAIYDINAKINTATTAGLIGDVYIDGTFIGAVDGINGTTLKSGTTNVHPLQQLALKSGKHTLEIRRTDSETLSAGANCLYFWGVNFTPVESATEELIPAVFGNAYAFIRETEVAGETEYKLVLVGAVYSTDLKRVGFCVGNESYSEEATGTTKVYKTINVAGSSYTAADFGLSDDDYIFYREVDVNADDTNLEFYAYAVNTDDSVVTGGKRTIAQPVKPLA